MKNIFICGILFLFGVQNFAFAQDNDSGTYNSQQLGVTASTLSGTGIYYIIPNSDKDNVKLTAIFIYNRDDSEKDSYFSVGAEYQRDLYEDESKRGHLIIGSHIDNKFSKNLYFNADDTHSSFFSLGTGFGFDIGSNDKGIILNAHITYQLTTNISGENVTRLGWGGGVGVGFNF